MGATNVLQSPTMTIVSYKISLLKLGSNESECLRFASPRLAFGHLAFMGSEAWVRRSRSSCCTHPDHYSYDSGPSEAWEPQLLSHSCAVVAPCHFSFSPFMAPQPGQHCTERRKGHSESRLQ